MNTLGGPIFERSSEHFRAQRCSSCRSQKEGAHYNMFEIASDMAALRCIFPEGEANELNFCLFSTSGVHGTYATIEDVERSLEKYPEATESDRDADDYHFPEITVVIVQPRICCLRYGNVAVTLADVPFLKKLRQSSWEAVQKIGAPE